MSSDRLLNINDANENDRHLSARLNTSAPSKTQSNTPALIAAIVTVLAGVAQTYFLQKSGKSLAPYPYFLFLSTAWVFVPLFWLVVLGFWFLRPKNFLPDLNEPNTKYNRLFRGVPQYAIFIMGLLTALNGVGLLFANAKVPPLSQALLGPTVVIVPMVMALSLCFLGTRYGLIHLYSTAWIFFGLFAAIGPTLSGAASSSSSADKHVVLWDIVWVLGSLPAAAASVYEEWYFSNKESKIHMSVLIAMLSTYQAISIVLLSPVAAIPGFGSVGSFTALWQHLGEGGRCFLGQQPVPSCAQQYGQELACDCESALFHVIGFVISYIVTNYASLALLIYGNATLGAIVSCAVTPLSFIVFSIKALNPNAAAPTIWDGLSLVAILLGAVLFRFADLSKRAEDKQQDDFAKQEALLDASQYNSSLSMDQDQTHFSGLSIGYTFAAPNVARARVHRRAGVVGQAATAPLYGDDNWDIERRKQFQTSNL